MDKNKNKITHDHYLNYQYLLIGSGRLAKHFAHLFRLNQIKFEQWDRQSPEALLLDKMKSATHILLAIKDDALSGFIEKYRPLTDAQFVHFSGAFDHPNTIAAHPLMTFGTEVYSLQEYNNIHFVLTHATSLKEVFPFLENTFTTLPAEQKNLYHAYCVLAGNLPILLYSEIEKEFANLNIPLDKTRNYFRKSCENFLNHGEKALTGPLIRNDHTTIQKNLKALTHTPYQIIYQAFLKLRGLNEYL